MDATDRRRAGTIDADLVEYVVVALPHIDAIDALAPAMVALCDAPAVRLLDLVVVSLDADGSPTVVDSPSILGIASIDAATCCPGALLSRHDIELISLALEPGSVAVVLLVEDRWAGALSTAARAVGGEVRAGERVARGRMEAALSRMVCDVEVAV